MITLVWKIRDAPNPLCRGKSAMLYQGRDIVASLNRHARDLKKPGYFASFSGEPRLDASGFGSLKTGQRYVERQIDKASIRLFNDDDDVTFTKET